MKVDAANPSPSLLTRGGGAAPILLLLLLALGLYLPALGGPYVLDDVPLLVDAPQLRGEATWREVLQSTRWVCDLTFIASRWCVGVSPTFERLTNVLIHWGAALLLWHLLRVTLHAHPRLLPTPRWIEPFALLGAAMWLAHPLQTQAVTYIVQRYEALAGFCILLTLVAGHHCGMTTSRRGRWAWGLLTVLAALLGILVKVNAAVAPLLLLLYDGVSLAGSLRQALRRRAALYLALAATWLTILQGPMLALFAGGVTDAAVLPAAGTAGISAGLATVGMTPVQYFFCQAPALAHYLALTFWPGVLVVDPGYRVLEMLERAEPALVLVVTLAVGAWWLYWRKPALGFLLVGFFVLLGPSSSLVPVADLVMEHRMYVALAGVLLAALGLGAWALRQHPAAAAALGLLLLLGLSGRTLIRQQDYRSETAFWQQTVDARPSHARAWLNLGVARFRAGDEEASHRALLQAVRLAPFFAAANRNLGQSWMVRQAYDRAYACFLRAWQREPRSPDYLRLLGEAAFRQQHIELARQWFTRCLEQQPDDVPALERLGRLAVHGEDWSAAEAYFTRALGVKPEDANTLEGVKIMLQRLAATGQRDTALQVIERISSATMPLPAARTHALQQLLTAARAALVR